MENGYSAAEKNEIMMLCCISGARTFPTSVIDIRLTSGGQMRTREEDVRIRGAMVTTGPPWVRHMYNGEKSNIGPDAVPRMIVMQNVGLHVAIEHQEAMRRQ